MKLRKLPQLLLSMSISLAVVFGPCTSANAEVATLLDLFGVGLEAVKNYQERPGCETPEDRAGRMADAGKGMAILGGVLGAVAGAASTGDASTALKWGGAGAAAGGVAGTMGAGHALAGTNAVNSTRSKLCKLIDNANKLRAPILDDFAQRIGGACGIDPTAISNMDDNVADQLLECARTNPEIAKAANEDLNSLYEINHATCQSGVALVRQIDQQTCQSAEQTGQSCMPHVAPTCSGRLSAAKAWYPLGQPFTK